MIRLIEIRKWQSTHIHNWKVMRNIFFYAFYFVFNKHNGQTWWNIFKGEIGQKQIYWFPGSLHSQVTSRHGFDNVGWFPYTSFHLGTHLAACIRPNDTGQWFESHRKYLLISHDELHFLEMRVRCRVINGLCGLTSSSEIYIDNWFMWATSSSQIHIDNWFMWANVIKQVIYW